MASFRLEHAQLGSCHLGFCHFESRHWENDFGKVPKTWSLYFVQVFDEDRLGVVEGGRELIIRKIDTTDSGK